jgi:hypothetical protein
MGAIGINIAATAQNALRRIGAIGIASSTKTLNVIKKTYAF